LLLTDNSCEEKSKEQTTFSSMLTLNPSGKEDLGIIIKKANNKTIDKTTNQYKNRLHLIDAAYFYYQNLLFFHKFK
jgi:hypothetical protein